MLTVVLAIGKYVTLWITGKLVAKAFLMTCELLGDTENTLSNSITSDKEHESNGD